ncbi:Protoglobin-domain-containing protein [Stachybotrys elegans]|uniref:Protoglobin-domain-containing protein n=1 Tax=Stachybotrys elegans TaxID=80388 RepID=A0A8K0SHP1_9HYPO|nr:Protoglobin-domain-containing protein [Stachybotrys elegans]
MATRNPMQHISREDLYTDLEARILYLHSFLDFSSNDIEALITGSKYIKALIPAVVNIVYKKLLQYDITARAFTTRSTSFEGPLDDNLSDDSPQILHRKMFMRAYLNKLCSDPSKMEFWEYLDKVGMMHVGLGRKHPLHIEYVHLGACLGFISDIMTEAILSHPRLHIQRKTALVKALNKVIWIQNDLMAKWHIEDAIEFDQREGFEVEQEGYLHGKKVLHDIDEETQEAGACPFSGMKASGGGIEACRPAPPPPSHHSPHAIVPDMGAMSLNQDKTSEEVPTA